MSSIGSIFHQAKWIVPRQFEELEPINIYHRENEPLSISLPEELKNLHITYKASLHMAQKLEGVTLRITADDCYKLRINGSFVCQGPAQGYYWNYRYNEVDITDYLTEGENELSCEVYYQGLINRAYNSGDRRLGLIFALFSKGEYLCGSDEATLSGIMNCYSMVTFWVMVRLSARILTAGLPTPSFAPPLLQLLITPLTPLQQRL